MRELRRFLVVAASVVVGGCATGAVTPHPTLHPSLDGTAASAGVSAGLVYATVAETDADVDSTVLSLPYGEGFVRFGVGGGQLELRVGPGIGFLGYRLNLVTPPAEESGGGVGVALLPSLGFGLVSTTSSSTSGGMTSTNDSGFATVVPGIGGLVTVGGFYVAPRFGFTHLVLIGDTDPMEDTTQDLVTLAINVGYRLDSEPFDVSFELALMRVTSTDDAADGAYYVIAPTVGVQL